MPKKNDEHHPRYAEMIADAIKALKVRGGASRIALKKYIQDNFVKNINPTAFRIALKKGIDDKVFAQSGQSFRLTESGKSHFGKSSKKPATHHKSTKPAAKPKAKTSTTKAKSSSKTKAKTPAAKPAAKKKAAAKPKKATSTPTKAKGRGRGKRAGPVTRSRSPAKSK